MLITLETVNEIKGEILKWAEARNKEVIYFVERGTLPSFGAESEGEDWAVEFLPQEGWAYVNGYKSLSGVGTNITDTNEVAATMDKMLSYLD